MPAKFDSLLGQLREKDVTNTSNLVPYSGAVSGLYIDNINVTGSGIFNGISIPDVFNITREPTGFVTSSTSSLSFNEGSRYFTISGTSFDYYFYGVKNTKTIDSVQIADTIGTHWIYYNNSGTLVESSTGNFSVPLVATVYWNGSQGFIGGERHGLIMDNKTHEYLHNTIGVRYAGGLTGSFSDVGLEITAGSIYDEDILMPISTTNSATVVYKSGAAYFKAGSQSAYYISSGGNILYNSGTSIALVPSNQYSAQWIFATNDRTTPIYSLMGQRTDVTIADARANNMYENLSLGNLPFQEMKLLYRVLLRNDGTPYEETQDLRSISNVSSNTYVATDHGTLTGLADDDHTQYLLVNGSRDATGNINISKVDPELRLTDTGNSQYARLTKSDTDNEFAVYNRVGKPGAVGTAVNLNGAQYSIVASGNNFLDGKSALSINCWAYYTGSVDYAGVVCIEPNPAYTTGIRMNNDSRVCAMIGRSSAGAQTLTSGTLTLNDWNHLLMTWASGGPIDIYMNGVKASSGTWPGSIFQNKAVLIGYDEFAAARKFNGKIDDVAIWSRKLTDAEAAELYAGGVGKFFTSGDTFSSTGTPTNTNLELLMHLDEGTGSIIYDQSPNGRNGSILTGTFTTGKVVTAPTTIDAKYISIKDGTGAGEEGIVTFGEPLGRTIIEGRSTRFNISGVEQFSVDTAGDLVMPDNKKEYFGTGKDASIMYDGNNMYINPTEVGTGGIGLSGNVISNILMSKSGPEIRLTNTAVNDYARLTKSGATNYAFQYNRVGVPGETAYNINSAGSLGIMTSLVSNATTNISFGGWIYPYSGGYYQQIFLNGNSASDGYGLGTGQGTLSNPGSRFLLFCPNVTYTALTTTPAIQVGSWQHVMVTRDTSTWKLYLNGSWIASGTTSPNTPTTRTTLMGGGSASQLFNGAMDEWGFWNRQLSQAEVLSLWNSGNGLYGTINSAPYNSGLIAAWRFNEATGSYITDYTGNLKTGSLFGTGSWGPGKVAAQTTNSEGTIWSSRDGLLANERGITTFGDTIGRTIIEGNSIKFNISGIEIANITSGTMNISGNFPLVAGNNVLFVSGNRIGINTNVPTTSLDIIGNLKTTTSSTIGSGISQIILSINGGSTTTAEGAAIYCKNAGNTKSAFGNYSAIIGGSYNDSTLIWSANGIEFSPNGGIPSAMVLTPTGKVGIGTGSITPTALLTLVNGTNDAAATRIGQIQINQAGITDINAGNGGIEFKCSTFGNGYGAKIIGYDDGALILGQRANSATWTENLRVTNTGNVGISTSGTPTEKLTVSGNINIFDSNKIYVGTGKDASIYYDSNNMIINPREVGTGSLIIYSSLACSGTYDIYPQNSSLGLNTRFENLFLSNRPSVTTDFICDTFLTDIYNRNTFGFTGSSQVDADSFVSAGSPLFVQNSGVCYSFIKNNFYRTNSLNGGIPKLTWSSGLSDKRYVNVIGQFTTRTVETYGGELRLFGETVDGLTGSTPYWAVRWGYDATTYPQYPWRLKGVFGSGITYAWTNGSDISNVPFNPFTDVKISTDTGNNLTNSRFLVTVSELHSRISPLVVDKTIGSFAGSLFYPRYVKCVQLVTAGNYNETAIQSLEIP